MKYSETTYNLPFTEPTGHSVNNTEHITTIGPDVNILDLPKLKIAYHSYYRLQGKKAPNTGESFREYISGPGLEEGIQFWVNSKHKNIQTWRDGIYIDSCFDGLISKLIMEAGEDDDKIDKLTRKELIALYAKHFGMPHNLILQHANDIELIEKKMDKFISIYLTYSLRVFWTPDMQLAPAKFSSNFSNYRVSELVWEMNDHPLLNNKKN